MTPKLLDLFCGAGGAACGYVRAGFEVVGVDIKPQKNYLKSGASEFIQADALEFCRQHGHEFDAIHASPPCQHYSYLTPKKYRGNHPDLIDATREALDTTGVRYVIENVGGARFHLRSPIKLCGSAFGLAVYRHRWFELGHWYTIAPQCTHDFYPVVVSGHTKLIVDGSRRKDNRISEKRAAMGCEWMTDDEITLAIPPAYTEFIGRQLLQNLQQEQR